MKEFSIVITVTLIGTGRQNNYKFLANPFTFTPTLENSSAGTLYNCNKDIVVDLPDKDALADFSYARKSTVTFCDSSGKDIVLGSSDVPAMVTLNPYLSSATLKIECKMPYSPFSR